jgi:hypothetical protein
MGVVRSFCVAPTSLVLLMTADALIGFVDFDKLRSVRAEHLTLRAEMADLMREQRALADEMRAKRDLMRAVRHTLGYLPPEPPLPTA